MASNSRTELRILLPWPPVGPALASNTLSSNPLTDCNQCHFDQWDSCCTASKEAPFVTLCGIWTSLRVCSCFCSSSHGQKCSHQIPRDGWSRPSGSGARLRPVGSSESRQVVWHSAATSGESVISTCHFNSRWEHFQPERSHQETKSCETGQKTALPASFLEI